MSKTGLKPFNSDQIVNNKTKLEELESISMKDMNIEIIESLLGAFLPVDNASLRCQSIGMEFYEFERILSSNAKLKFVEIYNLSSSKKSAPNPSSSLNLMTKTLLSQIPKHLKSNSLRKYTSLNTLFVARGSFDWTQPINSSTTMEHLMRELSQLKVALNPVEWNPFSIDLWSSKTASVALAQPAGVQRSSLTVATNRNKCVEYLDEVVSKSMLKYAKRAYVHWLEKYVPNIEENFENALENLNSIIDNYNISL